jgi:hypothetical protein
LAAAITRKTGHKELLNPFHLIEKIFPLDPIEDENDRKALNFKHCNGFWAAQAQINPGALGLTAFPKPDKLSLP